MMRPSAIVKSQFLRPSQKKKLKLPVSETGFRNYPRTITDSGEQKISSHPPKSSTGSRAVFPVLGREGRRSAGGWRGDGAWGKCPVQPHGQKRSACFVQTGAPPVSSRHRGHPAAWAPCFFPPFRRSPDPRDPG